MKVIQRLPWWETYQLQYVDQPFAQLAVRMHPRTFVQEVYYIRIGAKEAAVVPAVPAQSVPDRVAYLNRLTARLLGDNGGWEFVCES